MNNNSMSAQNVDPSNVVAHPEYLQNEGIDYSLVSFQNPTMVLAEQCQKTISRLYQSLTQA